MAPVPGPGKQELPGPGEILAGRCCGPQRGAGTGGASGAVLGCAEARRGTVSAGRPRCRRAPPEESRSFTMDVLDVPKPGPPSRAVFVTSMLPLHGVRRSGSGSLISSLALLPPPSN